MSRSAIVVQCMANNKILINFILNLVNYSGKRIVNKRYLMTILFRITANENGLKLFLEAGGFGTLRSYFIRSTGHRLASIKAYTILYRTLESSKLSLLYDNKDPVEDNSSSDESDLETDSGDEPDNNEEFEKAVPLLSSTLSNKKTAEEFSQSSVKEMDVFFGELSNTSTFLKLSVLDGVPKEVTMKSAFWQDTIEKRIFNSKYSNVQAFPDSLMLDADDDKHYINSTTNNFSVEYLSHKLQCAKNPSTITYNTKVVYSRDADYPPKIPRLNTYLKFCKNAKNEKSSLEFESRFECGNLMSAKQIGNFEYELLLSPDTHSCNGYQWFYFQVSKMMAGAVYVFNIVNFVKINSQYNYGMQPVLFSVKDYMNRGTGWKRCGDKIIYYGNNYVDEHTKKQFRTLSFWITFPHDDDYAYLAYHYPYTYSRLLMFLSPLVNYDNLCNVIVRVDKLCSTSSCKNEVPLVTITSAKNNCLSNRPLIFITSRVHPGETNSSWIIEGVIKFLLSNECEEAVKIRENFIFKIIPMLNPEGVIYGNTRNGLNGIDLNRCWLKPNELKCPEIYYSKKLITYVQNVLHQHISLYLDIHGHSRKKYFFLYGCNPIMSWNKNDAKFGDCQDILKVFPQMVHRLNPHIRLTSCKYKIQKAKESTGRVVLWREFGIRHSYTLECSYCSGAGQQTMNTKILTDIGASIVAALGNCVWSLCKYGIL
ncbi:hypothetical protein FQA39_LY00292 [Lamprigera yunnana]|nr:hypothetical protein FQA39_LY00292 [Lamprigera yunnana]